MENSWKNIFIKIVFAFILIAGLYCYENSDTFLNSSHKIQERVTYPDTLEIYYLDVGQADATLIRYNDKNVLIDGGNVSDGEKLVTYFKSIGVDSFQYVIGTHSHEDHIGGFSSILRKFPIEHFYLPETKTDSACYLDVVDSLYDNEILYETPEIGEIFLVEDLEFQVLWVGRDTTDLNQNSIVLKLTFGNTSYLFMGDATSEVEKEILDNDLSSDVLKVGHHGSKYSSSAHFIKKVYPKYAIISVGRDNQYGFPKEVVLEKLEYISTTIYRTDLSSTIHLISDGNDIIFDFIETDTNGGD